MERQTYLKNKREAARHLGVCVGTIEKLMRAGLPYVRVGGAIRFRPEDLATFVERQRVQQPAEAVQ